MNLATLVQSQTLATLLQALSPATGLVPGKTVEARLLSLAGDGRATAQVGGDTIALVLEGPAARQSALQPGAVLVLRLDAADEPGTGLRATLVEVRPPVAQASQPGAPATPTPAQTAAAAPAAPPRGETAIAGSPSPPLQAPVLPAAQAARLVEAPPVPGSTVLPRPGVPAAPQTSTQATPRMLAGPLLGPALARQNSLAPLLANMRVLADGSVSLTLPRPLLMLVDRVLAQAIPVDRKPVTAQMLKTAVENSGLFLEAHQVQGRAAPPGADLKAGLQALRDALAPLVQALSLPETAKPATAGRPPSGAGQPQPATDQAARPAPPRRDGTLVPQPIAEASLSAGEKPLAIVETLLEQTDAALDRIKLAQYASLPLEGPRAEAQQGQRWLTELPLAFHNGAAMLPLQIEKEPPRRDANGMVGPLWRVRFALDVEPMGPLQGIVTLQGRSVGITLWAEREETSRLLRGASSGLEAALAHAQFENGTIDIHTGQPRVAQPTAGQFLDRMS